MFFKNLLIDISSQIYYYYQRPIGPNMPDWRLIGDLDMLHWRPTCLIGDQHALLETEITHRNPTCPLETDMTHQRPTCLWRPMGDQKPNRILNACLNILIFKYF